MMPRKAEYPMKPNPTEPQAAKPQSDELTPDVGIIDAWSESFELARGISDLLVLSAGSPNGMSPESVKALLAVTGSMLEEMKVVDAYFTEIQHKDISE